MARAWTCPVGLEAKCKSWDVGSRRRLLTTDDTAPVEPLGGAARAAALSWQQEVKFELLVDSRGSLSPAAILFSGVHFSMAPLLSLGLRDLWPLAAGDWEV